VARVALLIGASGMVGGELLTCLLQSLAYAEVIAWVRRPLNVRHPKLTQRVVDFDRLAGPTPEPVRADDVFCCLGTTIGKAGSQAAFRRVDLQYPLQVGRLAKASGAQRYLIVTSMGADPHSRIFYNRVKGEVEAELCALGLPALHIFRPSLLLGERPETRVGEAIGSVLARAMAPLMLGGLRKYRPIKGRTVARAMLCTALDNGAGTHVYLSDQIEAMGR